MFYIGFSKNHGSGGFDVYVAHQTQTGLVPYEITIKQLPEVSNELLIRPSLTISRIAMHGDKVIDALLAGLREANLMPPQSATESELRATQNHLRDMRSIALGLPAPELKIT